jgi:hypothetical protein
MKYRFITSGKIARTTAADAVNPRIKKCHNNDLSHA